MQTFKHKVTVHLLMEQLTSLNISTTVKDVLRLSVIKLAAVMLSVVAQSPIPNLIWCICETVVKH